MFSETDADASYPAGAFAVPTVDIARYLEPDTGEAAQLAARARVAREIDTACREVGFIQILGHGVPVETAVGLAAAIDQFFALPSRQRSGIASPPG